MCQSARSKRFPPFREKKNISHWRCVWEWGRSVNDLKMIPSGYATSIPYSLWESVLSVKNNKPIFPSVRKRDKFNLTRRRREVAQEVIGIMHKMKFSSIDCQMKKRGEEVPLCMELIMPFGRFCVDQNIHAKVNTDPYGLKCNHG